MVNSLNMDALALTYSIFVLALLSMINWLPASQARRRRFLNLIWNLGETLRKYGISIFALA